MQLDAEHACRDEFGDVARLSGAVDAGGNLAADRVPFCEELGKLAQIFRHVPQFF